MQPDLESPQNCPWCSVTFQEHTSHAASHSSSRMHAWGTEALCCPYSEFTSGLDQHSHTEPLDALISSCPTSSSPANRSSYQPYLTALKGRVLNSLFT